MNKTFDIVVRSRHRVAGRSAKHATKRCLEILAASGNLYVEVIHCAEYTPPPPKPPQRQQDLFEDTPSNIMEEAQ